MAQRDKEIDGISKEKVKKIRWAKLHQSKPTVPFSSRFTWEPEKEVTAQHERNPAINK